MTPSLPESEIFVLLSKRRRRLIIKLLQEATTPITDTELAKHIGNREYEDPSSEDTRTIHLTLYHNHLPRLEEADVVEYNQNTGTVYPGINFDTLLRLLETVDETDLSWTDG